MRLKFNCEFCSFSDIQHFREQIIGEPYISESNTGEKVNFKCPSCGLTQWNINQAFTFFETLYLWLYQNMADFLGKIGLKQYFFSKSDSKYEWINSKNDEESGTER